MSTKLERGAWGVTGLALVVPGLVWKAHVLSVMWGWFVVPLFGLPALALGRAVGLLLVVSLLFHRHDDHENYSDEEKFESMKSSIYRSLLGPAILLLAGWIAQHWV